MFSLSDSADAEEIVFQLLVFRSLLDRVYEKCEDLLADGVRPLGDFWFKCATEGLTISWSDQREPKRFLVFMDWSSDEFNDPQEFNPNG